ncbi:ribosomal protein subunit L16 [Schizosaccharomyces cryophilus OY26]|uniref:Ribosomal protein subunit L16 n=1 Tax=Schizosaccharomyces cryophilus (strain OY26 / ATCC MYA-4695 / CBS 11777 / NBRC 106824 / NRRL Y48691) TaxID=653667 RepID=S9W298_SCHCR|nr:ribosomal protein subunit L16 [Schizosaccharomyces cryophilus OY26]EPY52494.1 ribosomal protein subunit L16 [Schizosaccharomyces cryophilus OY26]
MKFFSPSIASASNLKTRFFPFCFPISKFSTSSFNSSYVGKQSIVLPKDVQVQLRKQIVEVSGPNGRLEAKFPKYLRLKQDNDSIRIELASKSKDDLSKKQLAMWGTTRALLGNNVKGVSEPWQSLVKLVGVGYANAVSVQIPSDVQVENPSPTSLVLSGIDKQKVTQLASKIRSFKKPEPYKGKGIYVDGESIQLKSKRNIS